MKSVITRKQTDRPVYRLTAKDRRETLAALKELLNCPDDDRRAIAIVITVMAWLHDKQRQQGGRK